MIGAARNEIPMVTAVALRGMPEFIEMALGPMAKWRALSDAGLPDGIQFQEGKYFPETAINKFLTSAARQFGDEFFGALLGTHINIANYETLGRYLSEAQTLRECFQRLKLAGECFLSYCGFQLEIAGDLAWIRLDYATRGASNYQILGQTTVGSAVNMVRNYAGPAFEPTLVHLDIPRPVKTAPLEDRIPYPIVYNAPRFGVAFPVALLDTPRQTEVSGRAIALSDVRRASRPKGNLDFAKAVEEHVRIQLNSGRPSVEATASALDISVRKLQRLLGQEATTFRKLSRRTSLTSAREMLTETDMSLSAVASAVGYSEFSNFSRAFFDEYGIRPSDLRRPR